MNPRERILAISAMSMLGVMLIALVGMKLIVGPARDAKQQADKAALDLEMMRDKVNAEPRYVFKLSRWAGRSYGTDVAAAAAAMREHVKSLVARTALPTDELTLSPVEPRQLRGAAQIGLIVRATGSQEKLTSLLYLLQNDPHLHRLDNLVWAPQLRSTDVRLSFTLTSLVLDGVEGHPGYRVDQDKLKNDLKLADAQRKQYALIDDRDVFRPYIKRPPAPRSPARTVERTDDNDDQRPTPPPRPSFQLVSLSQWGDQPEIVVKDLRTQRSRTYRVGEDLIGGEIMGVDYTPVALPGDPPRISTSRVIVRIGREFFAVEIGWNLDDKRQLNIDQLPPSLRRLMQPRRAAPAAGSDKQPESPATGAATGASEQGASAGGQTTPADAEGGFP